MFSTIYSEWKWIQVNQTKRFISNFQLTSNTTNATKQLSLGKKKKKKSYPIRTELQFLYLWPKAWDKTLFIYLLYIYFSILLWGTYQSVLPRFVAVCLWGKQRTRKRKLLAHVEKYFYFLRQKWQDPLTQETGTVEVGPCEELCCLLVFSVFFP